MKRLFAALNSARNAVVRSTRRLAIGAIVKIVRFYQLAISPMLGPRCRFSPTCSEYCVLAVRKYGVLIGLLKTVWRILRCNPFGKGGFDPP